MSDESVHSAAADSLVRSADRFPSPTTRQAVEVILARQLAGYLALPVVIIDPSYLVVFYNEPAEHMLGRRFDEAGAIMWADWSHTFKFADDTGSPLPADELPMGIALRDRRPAHAAFHLTGLDGVRRKVEEVAIPLIGEEGRFLGALGLFAVIDS